MKISALFLVCLFAFSLIGCGGGGGGGSKPPVTIQSSFTIDWPARTRDLSNPLTSSLSAVVVFPKAASDGTDVSMTVSRADSSLGAHAETYPLPQKVTQNAVTSMTASFYSGPSGAGAVVGTASSLATLSGTTIQFSQIVFSGTIKHVTAIATSLQAGAASTLLTFSTTDASGNSVIVTPGSGSWKVVSGSADLTVTPDGTATPLQAGQAQVTVTVDGITSAPVTITVAAGPVSNATFQISWPARSRGSLTHSLSSALSASVIFTGGQVGGADITVPVDRDSTKIAAYTGTYTIDQPIEPTCKSMTASFYASAAEQGSVVGTATASVSVGTTSVSLASVSVAGTIKSVKVVPLTSTIAVGAAGTQLQFSALDGTGAAVAVTPGSATWAVASGSANLTLTPDGIATGTKAGSATVTATVDTIKSPPVTIQMSTSPASTLYGIDANDLAYDPNHNILYVCATASSNIGPSEIVPIDLTANKVGTPFAAGTAPTFICVSSDGSELFSANASGVFCRVPTSTHVVDLVFNAPANLFPAQLAPLPNAPGSFIAVLVPSNPAGDFTRMCAIYDGSTMRTNAPAMGTRITTDDSGTHIFGVEAYLSLNPFTEAQITSAGITNANGTSVEVGAEVDLAYRNGVVASAGYVQMQFLNAATLAGLGQTGDDAYYRYVVPSVGTNDIYLLAYSYFGTTTIQPYDVTSLAPTSGAITPTGFNGTPGRMVAAGSHRVAFLTSGSGETDSVVVESGLP